MSTLANWKRLGITVERVQKSGGNVRRDEHYMTFFYPLWHRDTRGLHLCSMKHTGNDVSGDEWYNLAVVEDLCDNSKPCPPTCRKCLDEVFVGGEKGKPTKQLKIQADVIHDVLEEIKDTAPGSDADTFFRGMMESGDFSTGTMLVWADAVEEALGDEHWGNAVRSTARNLRPALNREPARRRNND